MACPFKSASLALHVAALLFPGIVSAGVNSWRSALAAEPSRIASFPVDGTTAPAIPNTVNAAYRGTLQTGATLSTTAGRMVGTHSTVQSAAGRVSLVRDPAWDFADGTGTVEAFLFQTGGAAYNPCYFSLRQDGGAGVRYSLHGDSNGNNIYLWNGAAPSIWAVSPTMTNRLCHVAIVFDGGNVTAYLNGVSLGVRPNTLGSATSAPAQIGAAGPTNTEAWPGHIDEVSLYADALPAAAVSARYQAWLSNDSGTAPSITTQPASLSRTDGQSAAFSVVLASTAGATYRWQRDNMDIPGATAATYTIPAVVPADHGAQFRCIVYNTFGGNLSTTATLAVADLTPPTLLSAAAPYSPGVVILTFSEAVDLTGASFSIPGGTVTGFAAGAVPGTVVLGVTGLNAATGYRITAANVRDTAGNILTSATSAFTAAPPPVPAPIELVRGGREPLGPATRRGGFVISEINYHPIARSDLSNLEFVEIANTLPWTEDLSGFELTGEISYTFPAGTSIPAGGHIVVAADPASVQTVHSLAGVLGPYTGALNNSGGRLRLRDYSGAVLFEVNYDSGPPWQPAADGAGHTLVLARGSYGMDDPRAWDRSFNLGGSPGMADPIPADPYRTVVINEVCSMGLGDYIELYNYSSAAVEISGCTLSDARGAGKYVFPAATSLAAGGFLRVGRAELGFGLKQGGDTAYFRAPGTPGRMLDVVRFGPQTEGFPWGRTPDGSPTWGWINHDPVGPNSRPEPPLVSISEIFYNPPPGSSQLPFVEITNITGLNLNVGGWRLSGGVSYTIPAGTMMPSGTGLAIHAFSGSLNKSTGERLRLEKPVADPDGAGTVWSMVDEVTYGTGGRWGRDSDGGGSSLERRDLQASTNPASNWADSDESAEAAWVTLTNTGILDHGQPGTPANRLEVMLLGPGEVLIDNVELVQGAGANIVTNPGFESGSTGWAADGTHAGSAVEAGTGVGGSAAMHLRATGRGDLAGNRLLNVLTTTATTGTTRTLRAQVKYLRGHPEILFRLHGGWLETTGSALGKIVCGTPGAPNSRAVSNAGPAISGVTHLPVLPQAGQAAEVYAQIADHDGLSAALLNFRIDPATAVTSVLMQPRGAGLFSAQIPAQTVGKLAAFTITAVDGPGAVSTFPAATSAGECLIRWGEGQPAGNSLTSYRLWYTQATGNAWTTRLKNSNAPLNATFVAGDYRAIYHAGATYSGSPFHTPGFNGPTGAACDYNVTAPPDDRYLGETDMIWAGPGTFGSDTTQVREQTAWWIARKMRSPALHRRFVNVYLNGTPRGTVYEDTQQPNSEFLDEYFPSDSSGPLFKAQDWIEYGDDGATFGPLSRAVLARALSGGQHKTATYRYRWSIRSSDSANGYAPLHSLIDAFHAGTSATDPAFRNTLDPLVDQDSWSRALAIQRIVGNWDTWGWSYGKNMYAYKPANGPWAMFAWDMDFGFGPDGSANPAPDTASAGLFQNTSNFDGGAPGDPLATKFRTQSAFRRAYWGALLDAANGPMLPATINARIDLMTAGLAANGITANASQVSAVKTYISQRRNYINTQAAAVYGATTFALSGSSTLTDDDGLLTLTGTAPANVKTILINGVNYTPLWASETAWSLPLTLYSATNALTVNGLSYAGAPVGSFPVTITVTGPPQLPALKINEWMADNTNGSGFQDPADGQSDDWFELHNSGTAPVHLGGFHLTDTTAFVNQFQIPAGTTIPAGGWLLVWADNEPLQNGITPGQLHTNFRLSSGGEQIALYTPDGTQVDLVTFGMQAADQTEGRYPDSAAAIAAPAPTPGRRNALTPSFLSFTYLGPAGIRNVLATEPTHSYQYETSIDLLTWSPAGAPFEATGSSVESTLPPSGPNRFWRARLLP